MSLRLKELCAKGTLVKRQSMYKLNDALSSGNRSLDPMKGVMNVFRDKKLRTGFILIMLLLCSSTSGYVLATFLARQEEQEPTIIGRFTAVVDVSGVRDLYGWQALIVYNSNKLKVLRVIPGGFVGAKYPEHAADVSENIFLNTTDVGDGRLLLFGSMIGNVPGKNGNGTLATIIFGYFADDYMPPKLGPDGKSEITLWDSSFPPAPIEDASTTITIIKN